MEAFYHEEGRIKFIGTNGRLAGSSSDSPYQYEYTLTDYLGNGRVYFTDSDGDGTPEVLQENHYYPFGMTIAPLSQSPENGENKYQYNGKEHHADLGLHWTDYGARWSDAQLGRWHSVDPLADKFHGWSPYNYVMDNPLRLVDPDGKSPAEFEKNETNTWVKTSTKGDNIGVDFYHDGDITHITDRKGNWNTISDGKSLLSGEERSPDVDYNVLTNEFYSGTGPERSVFIGDDNKAKLIDEAKHMHSNYLNFKDSGKNKELYDTYFAFGLEQWWKGNLPNMQLTFMGSFTYSFYNLGDKTLTLIADSKSRTSATPLHLRRSYTRSEGVPGRRGIFSPPSPPTKKMTTTHQTYIYFSTYD